MTLRRVLHLLVRLLVPKRHREFVLGDLEEMHAARARRDGRAAANLRYLLDVMGTLVAFGGPGRRRLGRGGGRPGSSTFVAGGGRQGRSGPDASRGSVLSELWNELRAAGRTLRRRPAFAAVAAATLAIGVGAAAAGFGMVNQLLLRPLPGVADPGEAAYVRFFPVDDPGNEVSISLPDLDALREAATLLDGIGAYSYSTLHVSMGDERPVEVWANLIYGDFFEVLGVVPAAGRLLTADETAVGVADPYVAVISERLWAGTFGGAPDVVGRTLRVGGATFTVVGVAGSGFQGPERGSAIRLALGADGQEIAGLVARYALGIVAFGTVAGLAAAYGLSRLLESRLFGVAPADPASYAGSALLFAAVAAVACWAPTRSAMRVDPVVTLRSE